MPLWYYENDPENFASDPYAFENDLSNHDGDPFARYENLHGFINKTIKIMDYLLSARGSILKKSLVDMLVV